MGNQGVSRRSLAAGAAWAVPAIAIASAAPAMALSAGVQGSICQLFYGGGTINTQTHSMYLGVTTTNGIIPKDTVISWTICVTGGGSGTGGTNEYPTTNYAANGSWTLTLSGTSGAALPANGCFTATLTTLVDYNTGAGAGGTWCAPALVWNDTYSIRPGASVSATSNAATGPGVQSTGSGTLTYTAARRYPTSINTSGRTPHYYLSKSGTQTCYPEVQYSVLLSSTGYDNVTCWPAGVTVASPCTWGTTSCSGTTGQCEPRAGGVQGGQHVTPVYC